MTLFRDDGLGEARAQWPIRDPAPTWADHWPRRATGWLTGLWCAAWLLAGGWPWWLALVTSIPVHLVLRLVLEEAQGQAREVAALLADADHGPELGASFAEVTVTRARWGVVTGWQASTAHHIDTGWAATQGAGRRKAVHAMERLVRAERAEVDL